MCVSSSAADKKKTDLTKRQEAHIDKLMDTEKDEYETSTSRPESKSSDIIGDNVDINRHPAKMTKEKRTKSWHWFLEIGLQQRVLFETLEDTCPAAAIQDIENSTFLPSKVDCMTLEGEENFIFHIMHVLVRHVW